MPTRAGLYQGSATDVRTGQPRFSPVRAEDAAFEAMFVLDEREPDAVPVPEALEVDRPDDDEIPF